MLFHKILFHVPEGHVGDSLAWLEHITAAFRKQRRKGNRIPLGMLHAFNNRNGDIVEADQCGELVAVFVAKRGSKSVGVRVVVRPTRTDAIEAMQANKLEVSPTFKVRTRRDGNEQYRWFGIDMVPKSGSVQTKFRRARRRKRNQANHA